MITTVNSLLTDVLMEVGVLGAEETATGADQDLALRAANRVLDTWNAQGQSAYAQQFNTYVLTPGLSPHTIGPSSATWAATVRPERILHANLVFTSVTPNTKSPIDIHDAEWYANLPVPAMSIAVPTGLWYQPSWPNGAIYFNGKPNTAYSVELETETLLSGIVAGASFTLPPGYEKAIILSTAEELQGIYGRQIANLPDRARMARAVIFAANATTPRIATRDAGMPGGQSRYSDPRNFLTGWWS